MRMSGQYPRSRGADRWAAEEAREREAQIVSIADARARVAAERARVAIREADEREERERAARAERRLERTRQDIARAAGVHA
jgi:hypothetical protein